MNAWWTKAALCAALCGGLLAVPVSPAHAGLFADDEARSAILKLREQRAQDQEAQLAAQKAQAEQLDRLGRSLVDMTSQLDGMRAELARLRGQNEVLGKQLADLQQHQQSLQQGVEARVSKLEPREISLDGKTFSAEPDEAAQFDQAMATLRSSDFALAIQQFQALLKRYPTTGYRESALYWQGNAQYGLREYVAAISTFKEMLRVGPQHLRASEALLAIANCHVELKEPKQAQKMWQALVTAYPDTEAAQVARERLAALNTLAKPAPAAKGKAAPAKPVPTKVAPRTSRTSR